MFVGRGNVLSLPKNSNFLEKRVNDFCDGFLKVKSQNEIVQNFLKQFFFHVDHGNYHLIDVDTFVILELTDFKNFFVHVIQRHVGDL